MLGWLGRCLEDIWKVGASILSTEPRIFLRQIFLNKNYKKSEVYMDDRWHPKGNSYRSSVNRQSGLVDVIAVRRRAFDERLNVIAELVKQPDVTLDEMWLREKLKEAHRVLSPSLSYEDLMLAVDSDFVVWKAVYLTRKLTRPEEMRLMVALPMQCDADSYDVEQWIAEKWKQEVTSENLEEVIVAFRKYYYIGVHPLRG